ncbi:DUF4267 domain-containing protein [Kribbella sp. NPDC051770]|uniref:DUF4267 domain-containing protein n=1 Tax=Kribbella sp. NPDC051770 TaxID=3155413 RepID=UPI0034329681
MLSTTATVLAGLVGVAVVLMGASGLAAPQRATGFGIPRTPTADPAFRAWLSVKSVRDMALGALLIVVLISGTAQLLGGAMLVAALIPVGDAVVVLRSKGPRATAYGVHAATAAVMVVIGALLLIA